MRYSDTAAQSSVWDNIRRPTINENRIATSSTKINESNDIIDKPVEIEKSERNTSMKRHIDTEFDKPPSANKRRLCQDISPTSSSLKNYINDAQTKIGTSALTRNPFE